jgi:hypothetical protein
MVPLACSEILTLEKRGRSSSALSLADGRRTGCYQRLHCIEVLGMSERYVPKKSSWGFIIISGPSRLFDFVLVALIDG